MSGVSTQGQDQDTSLETIAFLSSLGLLAIVGTLFTLDRRARQQDESDPR